MGDRAQLDGPGHIARMFGVGGVVLLAMSVLSLIEGRLTDAVIIAGISVAFFYLHHLAETQLRSENGSQ